MEKAKREVASYMHIMFSCNFKLDPLSNHILKIITQTLDLWK